MRWPVTFIAGVLWAVALALPCPAAESAADARQRMVDVLLAALKSETGFVRIHAAEALLTHGYHRQVAAAFASEADTAEPMYRIGVWRVLARAEATPAVRDAYVRRITTALHDEKGPDRLHAAESLAKLGDARFVNANKLKQWFMQLEAAEDDATVAFPLWLLWLATPDEVERGRYEDRLAGLLSSDDAIARLRAGFALGRMESIGKEPRSALEHQAKAEPRDSVAWVYLVSAAARQRASDPGHRQHWEQILREALPTRAPGEQLEAATTLGRFGTVDDLTTLAPLLDGAEADTRIGAADGSLSILRRLPHRMAPLDWVVIGCYVLGMLAIGVYYARRSATRDDYLLGGRNMRPWAVGLSFFATIFSTITYMSVPGEVVKNGPMMLSNVLGLPFAVLVVGWFIIPYIMRLRVTSAYEILEARLGLSVRLLGSLLFLAMRLFWMAVIIYTTSREILVPVAGLSPEHAPYIAALLGLITVVYTSLGGFKAVVFTDVVQTGVLFGGAVLTIVAITAYLGGFGWVPTQWDPRWEPPVITYAPGVRVTMLSATLSVFVWQVCTAGSDQMAIQRYLATRDAPSARRMFATALTANGLVFLFLGLLGLALIGYFHARPDMLNVGQSFEASADRLFPQFIVFGLPAGVSGLVIAGLLAAAMSSLSSGVSASSSVVTVDFIERFSGNSQASRDNAAIAKRLSWIIGLVVVVLSTGVGAVQGNLLEVTFKVVNLLTAPLFGLFFMAMFVRFATPAGTWAGAVAGIIVAVLINYWRELTGQPGLSFMWAMPLSLAAQVLVGCVVSLLPIGPAARPMIASDD